jgi:hypothetical protein
MLLKIKITCTLFKNQFNIVKDLYYFYMIRINFLRELNLLILLHKVLNLFKKELMYMYS